MPDTHKAAFLVTKILLPIDFSPSSEAALEAATDLAQQFHARIHLVHIIPESPDFNGSDFFPETAVLQERRGLIEQKLGSYEERLVRQGVHVSFSIETGNDIVGTLLRVIKHEKADMVVISTHGLSGWRPFVFGSIAERLIKQVDCSLLLLQPARHEFAAEEPASEVWEGSVVPHEVETEPIRPNLSGPAILAQERLDRSAQDLAERGARTEQHYEQNHSLFTK